MKTKNPRTQQGNLFAQAAEFLQWQDLPNAVRTQVQGLLAQLLLGVVQASTIHPESTGEDPCSPRSN